MRKLLVSCTTMLLAVSGLLGQELRFGYVDDSGILESLPARAEVQKILDQEAKVWEDRFNTRKDEVKVYLDSVTAIEQTLEQLRTGEPPAGGAQAAAAQAADTSAAEPADTLEMLASLERLQRRFDESKKELVGLYRHIYGRDGVLRRRNAELSQSVLERIERAVGETSQVMRLMMVFDSSVLLYVDQEVNYTDQVMRALDIDTGQQRAR